MIGIRPLAPVRNSVIMQHKALNFVIYLPDVENMAKWLGPMLTKVSAIEGFCALEFMFSVQSRICGVLNIVKLRNCERTEGTSAANYISSSFGLRIIVQMGGCKMERR